MRYVSSRYRILIGEKTAEMVKMAVGNVFNPDGAKKYIVKGRHLVRGLPEQLELSDYDICEAIIDIINDIAVAVKSVFEKTPPELVGDIYINGIYLTGGGAMLLGIDKFMEEKIGVKCNIPDDAVSCVAKGTRLAFNNVGKLLDGFEHISLFKNN